MVEKHIPLNTKNISIFLFHPQVQKNLFLSAAFFKPLKLSNMVNALKKDTKMLNLMFQRGPIPC